MRLQTLAQDPSDGPHRGYMYICKTACTGKDAAGPPSGRVAEEGGGWTGAAKRDARRINKEIAWGLLRCGEAMMLVPAVTKACR